MKPATAVAQNNIPWRDRPFQTVQAAAVIVGLSPATIYAAAAKGRLELRKLGGRTLVPTPSLLAFIESAEVWSPSERIAPALRARPARTAKART